MSRVVKDWLRSTCPPADVGLIGRVAMIFTGSPRLLHTVSTPSPSARER